MKVHHLNCGTLCPACQRLINGKGSFFTRAKMVCHCLLLETRQGLVLVDTGFGEGDIQNPNHLGKPFLALTNPKLNPTETALAQVKKLGFKPEDVQHIIPTHLDLDHAGGLPDFPRATVHVHNKEQEAALHPTWKEVARYRPAHFAHQPQWKVHRENGEKWFGFDGIRAIEGLDDEVLIIPLAGHTRGHCAVAVKTDTGWLVHAGDAYFHHAAMQFNGKQPAGIKIFEQMVQINGPLRIENQNRLRDLVNRPDSRVETFCAHDPDELDRYAA